MKNKTILIIILTLFALVYVGTPSPAMTITAQDKTDTFRDMLISIQKETPDKRVTLDFISKSYSPSGAISHIGDDYVCIQYGLVESCSQLDKIQGVMLLPSG